MNAQIGMQQKNETAAYDGGEEYMRPGLWLPYPSPPLPPQPGHSG
jgi:hypothetical protein